MRVSSDARETFVEGRILASASPGVVSSDDYDDTLKVLVWAWPKSFASATHIRL